MNAPVFDAWRGKPLDDALYECRELYEDAAFPTVRRWREAGGKVAGHFQVYFPEELAHAAGMLPVKVRGAAVDAMQAESRFGSYLCSIIKTSLELALSTLQKSMAMLKEGAAGLSTASELCAEIDAAAGQLVRAAAVEAERDADVASGRVGAQPHVFG